MSISTRRTNLDPGAAASLVLVALTLVCAYGVSSAYKNKIDAARVQSETMYAETASNRRLVAAQSRMERERPAAIAYVRRVAKAHDASAAMTMFLRDVEASARTAGVTVAALDRIPRAAPSQAPQRAEALSADGVTLKARGTFAQLLAFEQFFSQRDSLVSVEAIDFAAAPVLRARQTVLTASIDATLYHLTAPLDQEGK